MWCCLPLTASTTSEVKNDHDHVIMQGICNKFIEVNLWFHSQIICSNVRLPCLLFILLSIRYCCCGDRVIRLPLSSRHVIAHGQQCSYLLRSWHKLTKHSNSQGLARSRKTPQESRSQTPGRTGVHARKWRIMWLKGRRVNPREFDWLLYPNSHQINPITVFPHTVAVATILFWIHKSLKILYSFLIKFSVM